MGSGNYESQMISREIADLKGKLGTDIWPNKQSLEMAFGTSTMPRALVQQLMQRNFSKPCYTRSMSVPAGLGRKATRQAVRQNNPVLDNLLHGTQIRMSYRQQARNILHGGL